MRIIIYAVLKIFLSLKLYKNNYFIVDCLIPGILNSAMKRTNSR